MAALRRGSLARPARFRFCTRTLYLAPPSFKTKENDQPGVGARQQKVLPRNKDISRYIAFSSVGNLRPTMSNDASATRPRVAFSQFSQLVVIPGEPRHSDQGLREDPNERREGGVAATWYSRQELNQFRHKLREDITRMSAELRALPTGVRSQDQRYECIGIELILVHGARFAVEKRLAHRNAILSEQDLQEQRGVVDVEKLRHASEQRSLWAQTRAQDVALLRNFWM